MELLELLRELFFFAAYISNGSSFPEPLSPSEEKRAIAAAACGDETARQKLISHNLRLVAHVAKKFQNANRDMDDLISIGTVGLIKAVGSFDANKGAALATYAARCIQNEILMSIRASKKQRNDVSISAAIGTDSEGNEITLADIVGTSADCVTDEVERRMSVSKLRRAVDTALNSRERLVIVLRYGLTQKPCMPQREVAKLLKISRSYVSRIEKRALEKLCAQMKDEISQ